MKDKKKFYLAGLVAVLLCVNPMTVTKASAADKGPCSEDIAKFCADAKPGGGRIADCLKQHEKDLSAACKEEAAAKTEVKKEKKGEFLKVCKDDIAKLCKDVKPSGGGVLKCLVEHETDLSAQCKEKIEQVKEAKGKK
ncbi:MAG: cysteine rich repeat-containing protein [Syntrophales bacterium]